MTDNRGNNKFARPAIYASKTLHKRWMSEKFEPGLVSVIIPTYNRAGSVCETLDSVFRQTYRPIEVVVVNDGSTDNTKEVIEQWHKDRVRDEQFRLRYFYQCSQGAPAARNLGLIESHGEFIQFLDSDDLLMPSKISAQSNMLSDRRSDKVAAYGNWRFFSRCEDVIIIYKAMMPVNEDYPLKEWLGANKFVPLHSFLWRHDDIRNLGPWDESLAADQDGEYSTRFLLSGGKMVFCLSSWVYYSFSNAPGSSIGADVSRQAFESRYKVISRIENELNIKGLLDEYSEALSMRYAHLAKRCALYYRDIANRCLKDSKRLSPNGRLPDIFTFPFLSRILGLTYKQRLGRFIRNTFSIPCRDPSSNWDFEPIVTVRTLEEVFTIGNPEVYSDDA